jgi:hypothetical protein
MGNVGFRGGNTPGVFADEHILHPFREEQADLFAHARIFDDVHRDIRVNEAQDIKVDGNGLIDFNDVLSFHSTRAGIHHKGHGMGGLIQAEPVENPDTLPCLNMIDDDPVLYLR